ncbi:methyl-accepting chemotaxis protein [Piscinibacterium candidicorallinum]|uniref:Methyl-accepting chemotaxis protein n=1 Tax=Piscinibacterium candidicorallinum TaxID=1793872 RepID=A0ABV7H9U6_9BURK
MFKNLSVAAKMVGVIGLLLLSTAITAVTAVVMLTVQGNKFGAVLDGDVAQSQRLAEMRAKMAVMRQHEKDVLLAGGDPEKVAASGKAWKAELQNVQALLKTVGDSNSDQAIATEVAKMSDAVAQYAKNFDSVVAAMGGGNPMMSMFAETALGPVRQMIAKADEAASQIVKLQLDDAARKRAEAASYKQVAVVAELTVLAVALLVGIGAGWWLMRTIKGPLDEARRFARRVAEGDLAATIDIQRGDEFGRLLESLVEMQAALRSVVSDVRESVSSISVASSEVAVGNQDLSQRTEQAASNLQQTASAIEQLTATVSQSADNARQASQMAHAASADATRGGEVVGKVVHTMQEISSHSKKINEIIGVIDGIAFQTNILALNASVEAARAGEQGRGFAVVAGEVRNLAQRSAQAAKEIKTLISASTERVAAGSELVQTAGAAMSDIVSSVSRVSDIIGEISSAMSEQTSGIGEVNGSVSRLDQMTQQNAALVEESAAAAESLKDQAERLARAVSVFRVEMA